MRSRLVNNYLISFGWWNHGITFRMLNLLITLYWLKKILLNEANIDFWGWHCLLSRIVLSLINFNIDNFISCILMAICSIEGVFNIRYITDWSKSRRILFVEHWLGISLVKAYVRFLKFSTFVKWGIAMLFLMCRYRPLGFLPRHIA